MIDEGLLPIANMRYIVNENPADQVLVPAPPSAESESAAMWRPADNRTGDMERIPLSGEGDRDAAAAYGAWLGASLIHTIIADSRPEQRQEPELPKRDEDEDDSRLPKKK
jgi:hypothetical protein